MNKWHQYLYGKRNILVHTDHQPLETIFKKSLSKAPRRLQRMMLKLQRYQFLVSYKKGKEMYIADTLSRAPLTNPTEIGTEKEEEVFRIELSAMDLKPSNLSSVTFERLKKETSSDTVLNSLYEIVQKGWPSDKVLLPANLRPYWSYRDEITVHNGVLMKSHQVVIPSSMRQEMLIKIHKAYQGADSSIRRARETLFWPGMTASIRQACSTCGVCAQYQAERPAEPMKTQEIPALPWERISVDLFQLDGKHNLVTVDHYSDFIELDLLRSTSATAVINAMKKNFARAGIPLVCVSDNGPQFNGYEYSQFAREYGFKPMKSSPYHSKGNGKAESAVKVAKNILKKHVTKTLIWRCWRAGFEHPATGPYLLPCSETHVPKTARYHCVNTTATKAISGIRH